MNDVSLFVHHNSSTPFFSQIFKSILGVHMFLWKITVLILKSSMIHRKKFTENLTLNLLHKLRKSITVNKITFFGIMAMQIKVERKSVWGNKMFCQRFYSINSRLKLYIRFYVKSVQIFTMNVHSKMTMKHSIYVNHWNYHENKHISQQLSPQVVFIQKKVDYSFHSVRCRCLPWMNSSSYYHNWSLEL